MIFSNDILLGRDPRGNPILLPLELLVRHIYVTGRSGVGKTKLLETLAKAYIGLWPHIQAGGLILDPAGTLHDSLTAWLASSGLNHIQIIPFDLRNNSWVCALNILRPRPGQDPAPLIHAAVRSILHGWKQADATETPRLAKWLSTLLITLYSSNCTLLEALDIIRSREIRSAMARQVENAMARSVWAAAANLREADLIMEWESTVNRLGRFLSTQALKLAFGQNDVSLDMLSVMERGHIVLACLATEGSQIAEEDAAVVGSLLVNEIFGAAKHRGKREGVHPRMFLCLIDEFQEYVSPVIAQSLAQLRGMGVGFVVAHQSPQQLMDLGPMGRQTLNAILSNATTRIAFQTGHPADLDLITPWIFRNSVDPDQIKHQHHATRVLGHEIRRMTSTSRTAGRGTADATNWSTTESLAVSAGMSDSRNESVGVSRGKQRSIGTGENRSLSLGSGQNEAESIAESTADGVTESRASGQVRGRSESESENRQMSGGYDDFAKVVGPEPTATFEGAFVDEEEEHRGLNRTIGRTAANAESESNSASMSLAKTRSTSQARAREHSRSENVSLSLGASASESAGENESVSMQLAKGQTMSESVTAGTANSFGGSHTESRSFSHGTTRSPMLIPILGQEALPPQFRSVDEQLFIFSQHLASLPDRHAIVRVGIAAPVEMTTPEVRPARITAAGARAWTTRKLKQLPFAFPMLVAAQRIQERRKLFEEKYLGSGRTGEPTTIARRIKES